MATEPDKEKGFLQRLLEDSLLEAVLEGVVALLEGVVALCKWGVSLLAYE